MIHKIKLTAIMSCALLFSFSASASFTYDGKYIESEYDKSFSIDYKDEQGNEVLGGTLAFANANGKQYIYISHPLGFKDLSYGDGTYTDGTNANDYKVGWGNTPQKNAEFAVHSEHFTLSLDGELMKFDLGVPGEKSEYDDHESGHITDNVINKINVEDGLTYTAFSTQNNDLCKKGSECLEDAKKAKNDAKADYINQQCGHLSGKDFKDCKKNKDNKDEANKRGNQAKEDYIAQYKADHSSGDNGEIEISFLSTLNYNSAQLNGGDFYGKLGEYYYHSPQTVSCNETSSDPSCYELDTTVDKNYLDGDASDGDNDLIDWQFDFGIEIELSKKLYTAMLKNMTAGVFSVNGNSLVSLDGLHASNAKDKFCGNDATNSSCTVTITEKPPKEVPEPSTIVMFVLALGLLRIQAKRRNA